LGRAFLSEIQKQKPEIIKITNAIEILEQGLECIEWHKNWKNQN
jgi:hypothetical protein